MRAQAVQNGRGLPEKHPGIPVKCPASHELLRPSARVSRGIMSFTVAASSSFHGAFRELDIAESVSGQRGRIRRERAIMLLSPREMPRAAAEESLRHCQSQWSDGKTPKIASGSMDSRICAASPMAGAVLRCAGSAMIWRAGTSGNCRTISSRTNRWSESRCAPAESAAPGGRRSPGSGSRSPMPTCSTCFACRLRLRGQKRVPLPPARIRP